MRACDWVVDVVNSFLGTIVTDSASFGIALPYNNVRCGIILRLRRRAVINHRQENMSPRINGGTLETKCLLSYTLEGVLYTVLGRV